MELYDKLNLNEIVEIVRIIAESTDIDDFEKTIYLKDVNYNIIKHNNKMTISSTEGKRLEVSCYDLEKIAKENYKYIEHIVDVNYKLSENEQLNLLSSISHDYNFSFSDILRHNLYENYKFNYLNNNVKEAELSIGFSKIKLDENRVYKIDNDIVRDYNKVISLKDNKLLRLNKIDVPSMEIINSFNLLEEKEKLNNYVENIKIHPFTIEVIKEADKLFLEKQKFIDGVKKYYENDIKDIEKVKKINTNIQNGINNFFTNDELYLIIDSIKYLKNSDVKALVKSIN